jgi:mono/diheme cytochrome c family protein
MLMKKLMLAVLALASCSACAKQQGGSQAANGALADRGKQIFDTNCATCHQADGRGVVGIYPPLAGNPVVNGNATRVIEIVAHGLSTSIRVEGHSYDGVMPNWSPTLSHGDIAAVVTYVRSAWGNHASAVTDRSVAAALK